MSQYIILVDKRKDNMGIEAIRDCHSKITVFDFIEDANTTCDIHPSCQEYPAEIINLDDIGWTDGPRRPKL